MPANHVDFALVQRSRPGRVDAGSAVACSAYNACARFAHAGRTFDFLRKAREHVAGEVMLPRGSPPELRDPETLWRACEDAERQANGQPARQVLVALPRELPSEHRLPAARAIAQAWVNDGMAVQLDLHNTTAEDGGEHPHVHFLLSMRRVSDRGLAKTKERDWTKQFREDKGRAERNRIAARFADYAATHDLAARIEVRARDAIPGGDEMPPPEPCAPRQEWQQWKKGGRTTEDAPPAVAAVLKHRAGRGKLARLVVEVEHASSDAAQAERELRAATAMPWNRSAGGLDGLTEPQRQAAERAYKAWRNKRPEHAHKLPLSRYVELAQEANEREAKGDSIGPADKEQRDVRRERMTAARLKGRYPLPDSSLRQFIKTAWEDEAEGSFRLALVGGGVLVDHGSHIEHKGKLTAATADATLAVAAAHGWTQLRVTGSPAYREAIAVAAALRIPPIETDHRMSTAAAAQVRQALQERAERDTEKRRAAAGWERQQAEAARLAALSPRDRAVTLAHAAERAAGDNPARLADARAVTTATIRGDAATIAAVERGDMTNALFAARAAEDRARHEAEERRRKAAEYRAANAPGPGLRLTTR